MSPNGSEKKNREIFWNDLLKLPLSHDYGEKRWIENVNYATVNMGVVITTIYHHWKRSIKMDFANHSK